ncbi:MAG: hypothetical protein AAF333_14875 [Planctomycetota bacterium]
MDIQDPVSIYQAENNQDARMDQLTLEAAGIRAVAIEDNSATTFWYLGPLQGINNAQVWIERGDAERAKALVDEYARKRAERRRKSRAKDAETIDAVCEDCAKTTTFPGTMRGSVQECKHCGAYVDLYEDDGWDDEDFDEDVGPVD